MSDAMVESKKARASAVARGKKASNSGEYPSGIYRLTLRPTFPFVTADLPIIAAVSKSGIETRACVTVPRDQVECTVLDCPVCKHRWAAEQPLRPGAVLQFASDAKWKARLSANMKCPECARKGETVQGVPFVPRPGAPAATRRVPRYVYLNGSERKAIDDAIDGSELDPVSVTRRDGLTGKDIVSKVSTGAKRGVVTVKRRVGPNVFDDVEHHLADYLQVDFVGSADVIPNTSEMDSYSTSRAEEAKALDAKAHIAGALADLNRRYADASDAGKASIEQQIATLRELAKAMEVSEVSGA